ncbi:large ribosomal subunit protein mL43 [Lethenteron reissneri]|uniref:large ribosomal subunit protein mL43 n=1 Tax=Lethenteron reissneri TaxID=7753 RepID=UPI002AB7A768|nr:large ribosomal subunit protein mL43 [Lethenteron reissneri]
MTGRGTASRFLQAVLHNGVGRFVCQLQRLTLVLSKESHSSRDMRDFVENHLVDFARQNKATVIYVVPRKDSKPRLIAEYLNGTVRDVSVERKTSEEILSQVKLLSTQSGLDIVRIRKPFHTDYPSIQGMWQPFTNKRPTINIEMQKKIAACVETSKGDTSIS